jgi:molybdopterin converting factor small subunit
MSVEIIIPPSLQPLTDEAILITVSGGTVGECLKKLVIQYPKLRPRLFTANNELRKGLNIFINREPAYPGELAKMVHNGDKLYISYIVMGG